MVETIVLIGVAIIAVEMFTRLPIDKFGRNILDTLRLSFGIIGSSEMPDEKKQKALLLNSKNVLLNTLYLMIVLIIAMSTIILFLLVLNTILNVDESLLESTTNWKGLVVITIASLIYHLIKNYAKQL